MSENKTAASKTNTILPRWISAWLSSRRESEYKAKLIVETETLHAWKTDGVMSPPNPFDPRLGHAVVLKNCSQLLDKCYGEALREHGPRVADHVRRRLPAVVAAILKDRERVMKSELHCAAMVKNKDTKREEVRAHHCESSYQISAELSRDGVFAQSVSAKPYSGPSLPCANEKEVQRDYSGLWWERYLFLGIGTRLYITADEAAGDRRWEANGPSRYARPLRRKLHRADPFKWEYVDCEVCVAAGLTGWEVWKNTVQDEFPKH